MFVETKKQAKRIKKEIAANNKRIDLIINAIDREFLIIRKEWHDTLWNFYYELKITIDKNKDKYKVEFYRRMLYPSGWPEPHHDSTSFSISRIDKQNIMDKDDIKDSIPRFLDLAAHDPKKSVEIYRKLISHPNPRIEEIHF